MLPQKLEEEAIFNVARKIPSPEARGDYLRQACGDDEALAARVQALLKAHDEQESFLAPPVLGQLPTVDDPMTERAGTVIGPYKLLEQIGEGGFGIVFMAEQQEPIRRKVALKVLKPGMDTREVIARFEAERQALALMDHPNIAKVLDAGQTSCGRPYFVMDLVKGVPITEFCDQSQLTTRERLELFVHVCQAVQHAHQKGIIHRDIKPSNVLVTIQDGTPLVKVIDFGIAKALGQQLTDKTLFTGFAQLIGTPLYMSPEQAALSNVDVDTRSDIYSLGVLLYELLTGTTPFDKERFKEAGYDEIRRIIREEEPPKPSTRISTLGQAATTASEKRQSDPWKLSRLFRGELDWIAMKALEKDRNRRYETASAFAADVQRYLNDEPVLACPPSAWYRFRKFARRNKAALATATAISAALLIAVIALGISYARVQAEKEQTDLEYQRAEQEKARARTNLKRALQALDGLYTDLAERGGSTGGLYDTPHMEPLRKKYLERALAFYKEFAQDNGDDPALRFETAKASRRVASILDLLGSPAEAEKVFQEAIALFEELAADSSAGPAVRREMAACLLNFAILLRGTRRPEQAEKTCNRVLDILSDLAPQSSHEVGYRRQLAHTYLELAAVLDDMRRFSEAEKAVGQGVALLRELAKEHPKVSNYRSDLSLGLTSLATILDHSKRRTEAEKALGEAVEIQRRVIEVWPSVPEFRWHLSLIYFKQAALLYSDDRFREAEPPARQALQLQNRLAKDFPATAAYQKKMIESTRLLGHLLLVTGRAKEGLTLHEQLLQRYPKAPEPQHSLAVYLGNLGMRLFASGQREEGKKILRRGLDLQKNLVNEHPKEAAYRRWWAVTLSNYGGVLAMTEGPKEAEKCFRHALALRKELWAKFSAEPAEPLIATGKRLPAAPAGMTFLGLSNRPNYAAELAASYQNLAKLMEDTNRLPEVEKLLREGLESVPDNSALNNGLAWLLANSADVKERNPAQAVRHAEKAVASSPENGGFCNTLGVAHYRAGNWKKAITALDKSMKLRKGGDANDWFFLAMAHWQLGHKGEARKWYDRAVEWMDKNQPKNEELQRFRAEAEELLRIEKKAVPK